MIAATRCLHGKEVRDRFDEQVAKLYHDLDNGFTPIAWLLPSWLPLPSFRTRDVARVELQRRFNDVIEQRRLAQNLYGNEDLLETCMTAKYQRVNDGRAFTNDETVGILIALLMAGQHTSSSTTTWAGFFIAQDPDLQQRLYEEQLRVFGSSDRPVTLDDVNNMPLLWSTIRETLRLRPPIMTLMRKTTKTLKIRANGRDYVVPAGNQVGHDILI